MCNQCVANIHANVVFAPIGHIRELIGRYVDVGAQTVVRFSCTWQCYHQLRDRFGRTGLYLDVSSNRRITEDSDHYRWNP